MPNNPDKRNQDSYIVQTKLNYHDRIHLFGVADGHGQYGSEVSALIKHNFPSKIL